MTPLSEEELNALADYLSDRYPGTSLREDGLRLIAEVEESRAQAEKAERCRAAIEAIKEMVVGDAQPRWTVSLNVTNSRMRIADICDAALTPVPKEEKQ